MKTLSNFTETKIDNPYVDIVRVVKIEFSGLTLNLCDRVWGDAGNECMFDNTLYEPIVLSWGTINCGKINPTTYEVEISGATITIDNTVPIGGVNSFSSLFTSYDPHFITITISEFHVGATTVSDLIDIFKGEIEDFPIMTTGYITISSTGIEGGLKNKYLYNTVDTTTYPDADPDDVGKMLPQVYGSAKRIPFMSVDAGWITTFSRRHNQYYYWQYRFF